MRIVIGECSDDLVKRSAAEPRVGLPAMRCQRTAVTAVRSWTSHLQTVVGHEAGKAPER